MDINLNEQKSLYSLVGVNLKSLDITGALVTAQAISYDINEMLGTKMRALMQRQQGRDLFDLWHAWTQSEALATPYAVDGKKAMEAFAWYLANEGTELGRKEAEQLLSRRLQNRDFRKDMDTLLRPGLPKFNVDAAAEIIRSQFVSFLVAP